MNNHRSLHIGHLGCIASVFILISDCLQLPGAESGGTNAVAAAANAEFPVTIRVDAAHPIGGPTPIWRFFGADEPNYATTKNGKKWLAELGALDPGKGYFPAHNPLTSGDGPAALKWGSTGAYPQGA